MKVLHLYPQQSPMLAQYVSMLSVCDEALQTDDLKVFRQLCLEHHPEIVHQHGCQNTGITDACLWARRHGIRIVLTPHGQLQPWEIDSLTVKRRLYLNKLRFLVGHAYTVVVRSTMEAETVKNLNWNTRIETIANPIITHTTSVEAMIDSYQRIYRQVMDSNVLELMDDATRRALLILLKAGITEDERWVHPFDVNTVNWHLLNIYAQQEGVADFIERGIFVLHINPPMENSPISYLPNHYRQPEPMGMLPLLDIIKKIYYQNQQKTISLLSLAELDKALRRNDVEEDMLMQQVIAEKMDDFLSALLTVVHEQTGLDEGFMPCAALDNKLTASIRNLLRCHLEI